MINDSESSAMGLDVLKLASERATKLVDGEVYFELEGLKFPISNVRGLYKTLDFHKKNGEKTYEEVRHEVWFYNRCQPYEACLYPVRELTISRFAWLTLKTLIEEHYPGVSVTKSESRRYSHD